MPCTPSGCIHLLDRAGVQIEGARAVFLAKGFDAASMNDIARAAGVSKGTLYVYFSDKEQLFEAIVEQARRLAARQPRDPLPRCPPSSVASAAPRA